MKKPVLHDSEAIHYYFGLSYATHLVLPRTLLQSMPPEWQSRFVDLLREYGEAFAHVEKPDGYRVQTGDWHCPQYLTREQLKKVGWSVKGRFPNQRYYDPEGEEHSGGRDVVFIPSPDPIPHYDRGRTRVEPRLAADNKQ